MLWIHQAPVILGDFWIAPPIRDYQSSIGKHVLINAGGSPDKARPWFEIRDLVLKTSRDSDGRRTLLTDLVQTVRGGAMRLRQTLSDTLRMMASMGVGCIDEDVRLEEKRFRMDCLRSYTEISGYVGLSLG